ELFHHFEPRWDRRHGVHADHQCAGSRDPGRVALGDAAGVSRRRVRAQADIAAVAVIRSSRDRWRHGDAIPDISHPDARRPARAHRGGPVSRVEVVIPDIGNFTDVSVVDVMVKPGDAIAVDSPLVTLETDKASMDVPSTAAGTVTEVLLKRGDKVSKGSLIARVDTNSQAASVGSPAAAATSAPAARAVPGAELRPAAPPAPPAPAARR